MSDKLFKDGLTWNQLLHFPIYFLHVIVFKFRVLGDTVSQNLETCDFCEAGDSAW